MMRDDERKGGERVHVGEHEDEFEGGGGGGNGAGG